MYRRILIIFLIFLPCHVQSVKQVVNCKLTLKKFFMQHMLEVRLEADKSLSPVKTQLIKIMVTVMVSNLSNGTRAFYSSFCEKIFQFFTVTF